MLKCKLEMAHMSAFVHPVQNLKGRKVIFCMPPLQSPNILLDKHYNAKIADTGLARTLFSKTHLSKTAPGGTYHWQVGPLVWQVWHAVIFSAAILQSMHSSRGCAGR